VGVARVCRAAFEWRGEEVKKLLTLIAGLVAAAAIVVVPAGAIVDGAPDGNGHPYVGLMVAKDAAGNPLWRCSGTLLSSTVFLTAGHCTEAPAASAVVWFDSGYPNPIPLGAGYPNASGANLCTGVIGYPCTGDATGAMHTHPLYNPAAFYLHDAGVVTLNTPVVKSAYGTLPQVNQFDAIKNGIKKNDVGFTAVGYGLQKAFPDAAAWKDVAIRTRMVSSPKLIQINGGIVGDFALLLSNNASTGGTCFGDSGGPNFLGTSNVVAGITSFARNDTCAGTGGVFRTDRQNVIDFVNSYLD
jgi:hypothetical protein